MATKHSNSSVVNKAGKKFTFEQLCIRKESGFSIDTNSLFMPSNPDSFDEVVFKLISKIDTSLLLLNSHGDDILNFTVIAIPLSSHGYNQQTIRDQGRGKGNSKNLLDYSAVQDAWDYLHSEGWHCLQSLALLQPDSIPHNGSRIYSLYQYTTCIMDVIRANYMFQKHRGSFHHETLEMFDDDAIKGAKQAIFGLLWKRASVTNTKPVTLQAHKRKSSIPVPIVSPLQKKRKDSLSSSFRNSMILDLSEGSQSSNTTDSEENGVEDEITFKNNNFDSHMDDQMYGEETLTTTDKGSKKQFSPIPPLHDVLLSFETRREHVAEKEPPVVPKGRRRTMKREESPEQEQLPHTRREHLAEKEPPVVPKGRRRTMKREESPEQEQLPHTRRSLSSEKEVSIPPKSRRRTMRKEDTPPPPLPPSPPPPSPPMQDVTLGFETSASVPKAARKSMARKSMSASDWPEQERDEILQVFDNFNPKVSEQKKIALTCKYVALQHDKDLPSKLLYQWIQKKGRKPNRTILSFSIPEGDQQKEVALKFFRQLNDSSSESARVAFSLKYLDAQFGLSITSKQLFTWLSDKTSKKAAAKKR